MRKELLTTLVIVLSMFVSQAQNVNIPSEFFKAYLVGNTSINTNADTEIQITEAKAFTGTINCSNQYIGDLTGIEEFTSLTGLICWSAFLSEIDLSKNLALDTLNCQNNILTNIDLSKNASLTYIACGLNNSLQTLNVANGNNSNVTVFQVTSCPNLTCIQIDDTDTTGYGWNDNPSCLFDQGVSFSNDCGYQTGLDIVNIPDANFKAYLVGNTSINTNADTEIQITEAQAFTGKIDCYNLGISDLTGIEEFINLTQLSILSNNLTTIDVSNNTALSELDCSRNNLTSLSVDKNTSLVELACYDNQLSNLDLSKNTNLSEIACSNNELTSITIGTNTVLTSLSCGNNSLTNLDVSNAPSLQNLSCIKNLLTSLNLDNNTSLVDISCNNNKILSLDFSKNTGLSTIYCSNNELTSITIGTNSALIFLYCSNNSLTNIDVSNAASLQQLYCDGNLLTSLILDSNTSLTYLFCHSNQLSSLDLSNQVNLAFFYAQFNLLSSLNLDNGNTTSYKSIIASGNNDLSCIKITDSDTTGYGWSGNSNFQFDAEVSFGDDCGFLTGISDDGNQNLVNIYPNPTNDEIHLSTSSNVLLMNMTGQTIIEAKNTNTLDISAQPKGVYILTLRDKNGIEIQKSKIIKK